MESRYLDERGVLRNKLGIEDATELAEVDAGLSSLRQQELASGAASLDTAGFGAERLQSIHRYLFQDLYEWAGEFRTTSLSRFSKDGMNTVFLAPQRIEAAWQSLGEQTQRFADRPGSSVAEMAYTLAELYRQANQIHAFREGNGRSLRLFFSQLAQTQQLFLDFDRVDPEEWNWACGLSAEHGHLRGGQQMVPEPPNPEPLQELFRKMVRTQRSVAFERLSQAEACLHHPELVPCYARWRELAAHARAELANNPQELAAFVETVKHSLIHQLDRGGYAPGPALQGGPVGTDSVLRYRSYFEIAKTPAALAHFLQQVRERFQTSSERKSLFDFMREHIKVGGESFHRARHLGAVEVASIDWKIEDAPASVRQSLMTHALALHAIDPGYPVHEFFPKIKEELQTHPRRAGGVDPIRSEAGPGF